jgi:hypothetical protein
VKCSGAFSACFACPNVVFMMPHIIGISNVTETCSKFSEILLYDETALDWTDGGGEETWWRMPRAVQAAAKS